ncbi:MAG: hypothetical protein HY874_00295 [Chloroflexi bacterium]|nr:hypothetical protein [Chloroflexota bacterium]
MRALTSLIAAIAIAASLVLTSGGPVAYASFHCIRIHAVLGSYNGNANIQFVELRMDAAAQQFVFGHTIQFRDAAGTLKATFTFPSSVANATLGDSILIATSEFNAAATGGAADFQFSGANTVGANGGDPLHPVQAPGGKVAFAQGFDNCDAGITVTAGEVDSLAYGAAAADFGTAGPALPAAAGNVKALRLGNLNVTPADNSTEYSLQPVSLSTFSVAPANLVVTLATPRNNGRVVLALPSLPGGVGGVASQPDQSLLPARTATASGGHRTAYALGAAAAALAALGIAALRRRRSLN